MLPLLLLGLLRPVRLAISLLRRAAPAVSLRPIPLIAPPLFAPSPTLRLREELLDCHGDEGPPRRRGADAVDEDLWHRGEAMLVAIWSHELVEKSVDAFAAEGLFCDTPTPVHALPHPGPVERVHPPKVRRRAVVAIQRSEQDALVPVGWHGLELLDLGSHHCSGIGVTPAANSQDAVALRLCGLVNLQPLSCYMLQLLQGPALIAY
mmetsp:Transcript_30807/g.71992  ORF Transcript_30807/g.71992 Transcript_30807/m.71992 type:complete len:207 (-) Transcript_30807:775-1395(-)